MSMMEVRLTQEQRDALVNVVLPGSAHTNLGEKIVRTKPGSFTLAISEQDANEVRELCMDRFQEVGIGPDSEPNAVGLALEDLTDLLFVS